MSDFIAEFRPKSHAYKPSQTNIDYISKSNYFNDLKASPPSAPAPEMLHSKPASFHSNEEVLSFVSQKQFSKGHIVELLHTSIITLVEKLLAGRLIASISGQIDVTLCHDDLPISLPLNKVYSYEKRSHCEAGSDLNIKLRQGGAPQDERRKPVSPDSSLSPMGCPNFLISDFGKSRKISEGDQTLLNNTAYAKKSLCEGSLLSVPLDEGRRRDSDVESGYNSSPDSYSYQRKSSDCSSEQSCNDINSLQTVTCDTDKHDDDEDVVESRLVIDIPANVNGEDAARFSNSKYHFSEMTSEASVGPAHAHQDDVSETCVTMSEVDQNERIDDETDEQMNTLESIVPTTCFPEDMETLDNEEPTSSSDGTDAEAEVNSNESSSSEVSENTIQTSHPQSMVLERPSGKVACKLCHKVLTNAKDVSKHAFEDHNLHSCSICFRTFTAKNNMTRHVRLHTGLRPYKCPHCPLTFARRDDMKGHRLRHDYNKPYRCAMCKKGYTDRACVKNHMVKEHGSLHMHFCPQCGESFDNHEDFSAHKKSHPELKQFSCKECFFIGNNTLMTMKHSLIHKHALFSCKPCNAYYSDPFDYTNHLRKHKRDETFTSYACCFCKVILSTYDQFVRHEYSHAQGKYYSCRMCKKQFKGKMAFQEHSMTHTNESDDGNNYGISENDPKVQTLQSNIILSNKMVRDAGIDEPSQASFINNETRYHDEESDGALDLSIKRPTVIHQVTENDSKLVSELAPTPTTPEFSSVCAPRNGCTPEFIVRRIENKSTDNEVIEINDDEPLQYENRTTTMCRGDEGVNSVTKPLELQPFNRQHELRKKILSRSERVHTNSSPYSPNAHKLKANLLDFLSKYQAARGMPFVTQSPAKQEQQGTPMSPLVKKENEAPRLNQSLEHQPTNHHMSNIKGFVYNKETGEMSISVFNSALKNRVENVNNQDVSDVSISSQLPTFIKSEHIFENEQEPEQTTFNVNLPSSPYSPFPRTSPTFTRDTPSSNQLEKSEDKSGGHECDSCKEIFFSFRELEVHIVGVHKRYPCQHCSKTFTARPNRDRHARFHTGERPYKCDLCHRAFHRGDDLKYHRTTLHANIERLACSRCSATFSWGKDLEKHLRSGKCCV